MKFRNRFVVLLFVLLYTTACTPVLELFKLPVLLAHFNEHKAENSQLSLLDFLQLHYISTHERNVPHQKHSDLPFKTAEYTLVSLSVPALPVVEKAVPELPLVLRELVYPKQQTPSPSSSYFACIWQPPRFS